MKHLKPQRFGEAPSKLRALSWDRTEAIGALMHGSNRRATRAPEFQVSCISHAQISILTRDAPPSSSADGELFDHPYDAWVDKT